MAGKIGCVWEWEQAPLGLMVVVWIVLGLMHSCSSSMTKLKGVCREMGLKPYLGLE